MPRLTLVNKVLCYDDLDLLALLTKLPAVRYGYDGRLQFHEIRYSRSHASGWYGTGSRTWLALSQCCVAQEFGKHGITVNAYAPGMLFNSIFALRADVFIGVIDTELSESISLYHPTLSTGLHKFLQ